jgi:hypothetical protein
MNITIKNGTDTRTINSDDVKGWVAIGWTAESAKTPTKPLVKDTKTPTSNKE